MKWTVAMLAVGANLFCFGQVAYSNDAARPVVAVAERVRLATLQSVDHLLSIGIDEIFSVDYSGKKNASGFTLKGFRSQLELIRWESLSKEENLPVFIGSRRSAFYLHHEIHISPDLEGHSTEDLALIGLHECLGALGYNDADYQISTTLWILNGIENPETLALFRSTAAWIIRGSRFQLVTMAGGSGTIVGGGGDIFAAVAKARVLREILREKSIRMTYYLALANVPFEPDYSESGVVPTAEEDAKRKFTVFLPVKLWMQGREEDRVSIVTKTMEMVLDKVPAQALK